jgi:hypothetical protein
MWILFQSTFTKRYMQWQGGTYVCSIQGIGRYPKGGLSDRQAGVRTVLTGLVVRWPTLPGVCLLCCCRSASCVHRKGGRLSGMLRTATINWLAAAGGESYSQFAATGDEMPVIEPHTCH